MDREGIIVLDTEHGAAVIDDRDVEAISVRLCDPAGRALDEDGVTTALERIQSGRDGALHVRYGTANVPLLPATAEEIAAQLAFVRDPQPLPAERAG